MLVGGLLARFFVLMRILFIGSFFLLSAAKAEPQPASLADEDCDPAEALAVASAADDVEQIEEIVNDIIPCEHTTVGTMGYYGCIKKHIEANNFENAKLLLSVPKIFSNIYSDMVGGLKKFKIESPWKFNFGFQDIQKNKEIHDLLIKQLFDKTIHIVQRLLYLDFLEVIYNKNFSKYRGAVASQLKGYTIEPESLEKSVHFYLSSCDNTDEKGKNLQECITATKDIAMNVNTPPLPMIIPKTASKGGRGLSSFNNKPHREWPKPFGF